MNPKLAFEITINDMDCIVFAATLPKARWIAVRSFWEAGYGREGMWPQVRAKRRIDLDNNPKRDLPSRAWCPDYVTPTAL